MTKKGSSNYLCCLPQACPRCERKPCLVAGRRKQAAHAMQEDGPSTIPAADPAGELCVGEMLCADFVSELCFLMFRNDDY